ncbi:MAG: type I 3-dehydroquinate dehydratase [Methanocorpusculum sp.]|nr:type I 3-dehydroquinate dehydratase [Methanocorpusculum sp.]
MTKICAAVTNPGDGISAVRCGADAVEYRLDLFAKVPDDLSFFRCSTPEGEPVPTIATFRGLEDTELFEKAFEAGAALADIEGTSSLRDEFPGKTICSVHDFEKTPSAPEILELMRDLSDSGLPKGAFSVSSIADLLSIADAAAVLRKAGAPFILIGMGTAGKLTRVRAETLGSYFTYVSNGVSAAPGELTFAETRALTQHPMVTGLVGSREAVKKSLSPAMHRAAFASAGIPGIYLPFAVSDEEVSLIPRLMQAYGIDGLNVTMPHKKRIIPYLPVISESAKRAGAVNTVTRDLAGHNTDITGVKALFSGFSPAGKRVLLLGAGGAARAASVYLKDAGAKIFVANRTFEHAASLASFCGGAAVPLSGLAHDYDAVLVASPVSPVLPDAVLKEGVFVCDMRYPDSDFLQEARAAGCRTATGISMLAAQGAASFTLWTGKEADIAVMNDTVTNEVPGGVK